MSTLDDDQAELSESSNAVEASMQKTEDGEEAVLLSSPPSASQGHEDVEVLHMSDSD
jgi:hypothetical protein